MYKIIGIYPTSIAGALIIKGLLKGFENLGNTVLGIDIREIDKNVILKFKPDLIIGYDYAHFFEKKAEEIIKSLNIPVIHYFGDDPLTDFSHSGKTELINKLYQSDDMIFCWDRQCLKFFNKRVFYLPLGIDADLYKPIPDKQVLSEIVFVGRPLTQKRLDILTTIIANFPDKLSIFCYEKHFDMSLQEITKLNYLTSAQIVNYKRAYKGFVRTENELARIYSNAKICLNITEQGYEGVNYRVFEVLASGGFLLTDHMKGIKEMFQPNNDLVIYNDKEELMQLISEYIENKVKREYITKNTREKILKNHTFTHRAEEILNRFKNCHCKKS